LLIERGLPLDVDVGPGCLSHTMAWNGTVDIMKKLLEMKAPMTNDPHLKVPPMNSALASGNFHVAMLLINHKMDCTWRHTDGASALHASMAWIAENNGHEHRDPPVGDRPETLIRALISCGADPSLRESLSTMPNQGPHRRSQGMTPLQQLEISKSRSPWYAHSATKETYQGQVDNIATLLKTCEKAAGFKNYGNELFKRGEYAPAVENYKKCLIELERVNVKDHHIAVLHSNLCACYRKMPGKVEDFGKTARAGLDHWATDKIRKKLMQHLQDARAFREREAAPCWWAELPSTITNHVKLRRRFRKPRSMPQGFLVDANKSSEAPVLYPEGSSCAKDWKYPGPLICPAPEAQRLGWMPKNQREWWDADSEEEAEEERKWGHMR